MVTYVLYIYDLGVHENRTKWVENKVDTLKQVVFLECAQC